MVRCDGQDTSWREADVHSNCIANGLAGLGISAGDRVGILANNCSAYCEATLAILKLGAFVVPLNVRLVARELEYIVGQSGCSVILVGDDLADSVTDLVDRAGMTIVQLDGKRRTGMVDYRSFFEASSVDPEQDGGLNEPAFICYTSGTTGQPKGAVLTHQNVWTQSIHRILSDNWCSDDRVYLPFPLSFTGGIISNWMCTLFAGATIVLDHSFDAARALDALETQKITTLLAVPAVWAAIAQQPGFDEADLSSLVHASAGGAPVPEPLIRRLQAKGIPLAQGWGLTEGSGMSTALRSKDALRKLGFAGLPMMHTRCKVVREDGSTCKPDEIGELLLKGPDVMAGYWQDENATAGAIIDGWLHTGDLGLKDDEGFVKLVGRSKDMLITGGLNVYPAEVESVLAGFPGVVENAVMGIPHDKWGETVLAIIISDGKILDTDEIIAFCKAELADYKIPRYIVFRDQELPRGMSGKVLKMNLQEEYKNLASEAEPVR